MIRISDQAWDSSHIELILSDSGPLELDGIIEDLVSSNRAYLEDKVDSSDDPIYGINTGFGSLCDIKIHRDKIHDLQLNLIRSHACGTGPEVQPEIVRLIQALKIKNLSLACSGVRYSLLEHMVAIYNAGIRPEMFQQGSLGASGDLAPLSHLAINLVGEGHAYLDGNKLPAHLALSQKNIEPIVIQGKEGLALLNGTQFSTAYLAYACIHGKKLYHLANLTTAMSYEAYRCSIDPLDPRVHKVRNQHGQIETAAEIRKLLVDGNLPTKSAEFVQDPYAFRCSPQVHGASLDTIIHCTNVMTREINAVTDNPLIFSDTDDVISGGNFHAQPIALANDFLAIALAELGSISERRTYNLLDGKRGLPNYLVSEQGLNSGFMIAQYTAAAIVSENKQLCTPSSIDSITSSKGQEDHVSMAANAGRKLYTVVENLYQILAIELLTACQALDFQKIENCSSTVKSLHQLVRKEVKFIEKDIVLGEQLRLIKNWITEGGLDSFISK